MTANEAAELIHKRRVAMGLSALKCARETGVVPETLRNIEKHRTVPKIDVFFDMLETLGLEVRIVPKGAE